MALSYHFALQRCLRALLVSHEESRRARAPAVSRVDGAIREYLAAVGSDRDVQAGAMSALLNAYESLNPPTSNHLPDIVGICIRSAQSRLDGGKR